MSGQDVPAPGVTHHVRMPASRRETSQIRLRSLGAFWEYLAYCTYWSRPRNRFPRHWGDSEYCEGQCITQVHWASALRGIRNSTQDTVQGARCTARGAAVGDGGLRCALRRAGWFFRAKLIRLPRMPTYSCALAESARVSQGTSRDGRPALHLVQPSCSPPEEDSFDCELRC